MNTPLLGVSHLVKTYPLKGKGFSGPLHSTHFNAVADVSFEICRGETFGLVGESGCGKSTIAKMIMCLETPTSGEIYFEGKRIDNLSEAQRRPGRPRFQMVFQDSGTTLNPRKRIGDLLREPMLQHSICAPDQVDKRIDELLSDVGLSKSAKTRFPHEFSGGQRQRICIARAISLNPELIVLDEPVSALDVSVQAQILNLLQRLQKERNLTYLFISHGLGAVRYICHRISVMYKGQIIETGMRESIFSAPAHPYTCALLDAAPTLSSVSRSDRLVLSGEVNVQSQESGCPLLPRCPLAGEHCQNYVYGLHPVPGDEAHFSACMQAMEAHRNG